MMINAVSDLSTAWASDLSAQTFSSPVAVNSYAMVDGISPRQPWEDLAGPTLQPPQPQPVAEPVTLTGVLIGVAIGAVAGVIAGVVSNEINRALHPEDRKPCPQPQQQPQPAPHPQAGIVITPLPPRN